MNICRIKLLTFNFVIETNENIVIACRFEHGELPEIKPKDKASKAVVDFITGYLARKPTALPPLDLSRYTDAERKVYAELIRIPFGRIISYAGLAELSGSPQGARFIGNCMAKNDFPILIPCHRVIYSDRSLGNYSGGIEVKKELLTFEGVKIRM
jgi:O-6-methylguanine DNA methyltransferase